MDHRGGHFCGKRRYPYQALRPLKHCLDCLCWIRSRLVGFVLVARSDIRTQDMTMWPNNALQPTPGGAVVCKLRLRPGAAELWR